MCIYMCKCVCQLLKYFYSLCTLSTCTSRILVVTLNPGLWKCVFYLKALVLSQG